MKTASPANPLCGPYEHGGIRFHERRPRPPVPAAPDPDSISFRFVGAWCCQEPPDARAENSARPHNKKESEMI